MTRNVRTNRNNSAKIEDAGRYEVRFRNGAITIFDHVEYAPISMPAFRSVSLAVVHHLKFKDVPPAIEPTLREFL